MTIGPRPAPDPSADMGVYRAVDAAPTARGQTTVPPGRDGSYGRHLDVVSHRKTDRRAPTLHASEARNIHAFPGFPISANSARIPGSAG